MQIEKRLPKLPPEKFKFIQLDDKIKDVNLETKPIGFFKDAMLRLRKNKASVLAFWIICVISLLAIFGPGFNPYTFREQNADRANMPPRVPGLEKLGILDGSAVLTNRRLENLNDASVYPEGAIFACLTNATSGALRWSMCRSMRTRCEMPKTTTIGWAPTIWGEISGPGYAAVPESHC